ncbi:haloacid dehalogenase type II [Rhodococcus sp. H36-A4]|uniref:haloacid dehalogenase type II n=1 Tax=Rhodococcus sp. H36-A4 TaxID=3004353 RepID=UPI0022AF102F|nr:haloacid dehalogenase type II [Rhodococcus sp. H36-A4]MCZ4077223.1 haloacid dehalogenase type II [Rhodococcus sp. H36-A4]
MNAVPDDPGSIDQVPVPNSRRPRVIVFDVNETLSDMSTMPKRFVDVGAPSPLTGLWFGGLLRDGFALSTAGNAGKFADVGSGLLKAMLHGVELNRPLDAAVEHIMDGFAMLDVHPDVADGVVALAELGIRMVTLSNGSVGVAEKLLDSAGLLSSFDMLLSVDEVGEWKPAVHAYEYALAQCDVDDPREALLVAVHPWDIDGASRAGLATAWLNRNGDGYPDYFHAPNVEVTSLVRLAQHFGSHVAS